MSAFREMAFTPAEFARLAKIDRKLIDSLEEEGFLHTFRKKVGNVERKMISLPEVQSYFQHMRNLDLERLMADLESQATVSEPIPQENTIGFSHYSQGSQIQTHGTGATAAADPIPIEAVDKTMHPVVAAATAINRSAPSYKKQMFYNVKGGTGKSTLTAQYVMRAAMMGYKILAIDLDGQGHLTMNLDCLEGHDLPTIYDVLINDLPIEESIINVAPGLDLIPANLGICNIDIPLNQKPRREYRLSEAIDQVAHEYDLIVADTNPAASILNSSMLVAADLVNVVCATNPLSFHGMSLVMSTIEEMEREFRMELAVRIIPNMYDSREVISQEVLGELRSQFEGICTHSVVNRTVDLNEATKRRSTVWTVNSKGTGVNDINSLTEELIFI